MTLEDRIRNTGEHLLGSLDPSPDLPQRIHHRIDRRVQQRRQRAAAGLGAGVVVVLGGLVVLNLDDPVDETPTVALGSAAPTVDTLPTTLAMVTSSTAAPMAPTTPTVVTTITVADDASPHFDPIPGAPTLYAARAGEMMEIDLATGTMAASSLADETPAPTAGQPADGSLFEIAFAGDADACGQRPVIALDADGVAITGFPTVAAALTLSRNGSTGLIRYAECIPVAPTTDPSATDPSATGPIATDQTEMADPTVAPVWRVATFRTGDPVATLTPVDGASWGELSDDGRYLLVEDSDGAPMSVLDLDQGSSTGIVPEGCSAATADPAAGYLVGDGGVAFLAWCDGTLSLITGSIADPHVTRQFSDCQGDAALALQDPDATDASMGWVAVADREQQIAWVANAEIQSGPIPAGDRVAWYPVSAG